jgi:hypothetical protein
MLSSDRPPPQGTIDRSPAALVKDVRAKLSAMAAFCCLAVASRQPRRKAHRWPHLSTNTSLLLSFMTTAARPVLRAMPMHKGQDY